MPERFHVLLQPAFARQMSDIVKDVKQRGAFPILEELRGRLDLPSSQGLLSSLRLPPTAHDHAHYRVWRRRFVLFNV